MNEAGTMTQSVVFACVQLTAFGNLFTLEEKPQPYGV